MLSAELNQIRLQMVGSKKLSDIVFAFKNEDKLLHAHKAILSINCIVFERMFCGDFPASDQIEIVDIRLEIFVEIIKYIYTLETTSLNIRMDNMLELIYAAQKYILSDLIEYLVKFIKAHTNDTNFLNVLDFTYHLEQTGSSAAITAECVDTFIDNPLHFFKDPQFQRLSAATMRLFLGQPSMNCTGEQLKTNVLKWMKAQQTDSDILGDFDDLTQDKHLKLETHFFIKTSFPSYRKINSYFTNNKKIYLYGIGISAGIFPDDVQKNDVKFRETFKATLYEKPDDESKIYNCKRFCIEQSIQQKNTVFIHQIVFDKVLLKRSFRFELDFGVEIGRPVFHRTVWETKFRNTSKLHPRHEDIEKPFSCIVYLLYSEVAPDEMETE